MEYRLLQGDAEGSVVATSDDLDSELAAMTWARTWLESHADHDRYRLDPAAGDRRMLMVRTLAGQWYTIPIAAQT